MGSNLTGTWVKEFDDYHLKCCDCKYFVPKVLGEPTNKCSFK